MKKRILLLSAIALLILIAASVLIILNLPQNVAVRAVAGFADDLLEREEIKPVVSMLREGSLDLSVGDIRTNGSQSPKKISVAGKMYFSEDSFMLSGLDVRYNSFRMNGEAYLSAETVYLKENNILCGTYGARLDTLASDLKRSIFAPDSGSQYALDQEAFDSLIATAEAAGDQEAKKDSKKLIAKVLTDIWGIVIKHAEVSATVTDIPLNGKDTDVRMISIVIDETARTSIIEDTCNYLCDSEDIIRFVEEHESTAVAMLDLKGDTLEAYKKYVSELEESAKDYCETFQTISVNIATKRLSATLLQIGVEVDGETVFMLDCGENGVKKADKISLEYMDISACYTVKNDELSYEGCVTATRQNESLLESSLKINKESDSYSLNVKTADSTLALVGEWSGDRETTTISVDRLTHTEINYVGKKIETTVDLSARIIIHTNDKMPAPSDEFATIDNITDESLNKLRNSLIRAMLGK